jgi:hypothetical protein
MDDDKDGAITNSQHMLDEHFLNLSDMFQVTQHLGDGKKSLGAWYRDSKLILYR